MTRKPHLTDKELALADKETASYRSYGDTYEQSGINITEVAEVRTPQTDDRAVDTSTEPELELLALHYVVMRPHINSLELDVNIELGKGEGLKWFESQELSEWYRARNADWADWGNLVIERKKCRDITCTTTPALGDSMRPREGTVITAIGYMLSITRQPALCNSFIERFLKGYIPDLYVDDDRSDWDTTKIQSRAVEDADTGKVHYRLSTLSKEDAEEQLAGMMASYGHWGS